MKKTLLALAFSLPLIAPAKDVAPVVRTLEIQNVSRTGEILKEERNHPYTKFVLGIPAEVITGDVCTEFVGQSVDGKKKVTRIDALGASNPLVDACIDVLAPPVKTMLTVEMNVLTGGFVPAQGEQTQYVRIGRKPFLVTLNVDNNTVTITSASILP